MRQRRPVILALTAALCAAPSAWGGEPAPVAAAAAPAGSVGGEAAAQESPAAGEPAAPAVDAPPSPAAAGGAGADPANTRGTIMRAYQAALEKKGLGSSQALSRERIATSLVVIERKLLEGRRDEAIGDLVYLVESPKFEAFESFDEARAALYALGDALGRAGAEQAARGYLQRLLAAKTIDTWYRRAVHSLVDLALQSDHSEALLTELERVPATAPAELRGDIAYLRGRVLERAGKPAEALKAYAEVGERARFWAQAHYLSGLIEVERGKLDRGEALFCKVADKKLTPRLAPVFGGSDFFAVRDLARVALGRVAHEQYRFDDSRYYYYLVPADSEQLPQALYESATSRYEAKDYRAARDLVDELKALEREHPYQDELWLFDSYVDLALCDFPRADLKLQEFIKRHEPMRDAARRLTADDVALRRLLDAVRTGRDPAIAGLGLDAAASREVAALLRVDAEYGLSARRVAQLDHQILGLSAARADFDVARKKLASPKEVVARTAKPIAGTTRQKLEQAEAQLAEVRRLHRELSQSKRAGKAELLALNQQIQALDLRVKAARTSLLATPEAAESKGQDLGALIDADRARTATLEARATKVRDAMLERQATLARAALARLDHRLSRLLRRARLGRIETVLGKKRALEVEVEALAQGYLPRGAVDSLDAARYLQDDEEYWPFDGEDWEDEYVGGEGLR